MNEKYVPDPVLDPDTMSIGEFMAFEEITGMGLTETIAALTGAQWAESATVLLATMMIAGAREREGWTLEDAAAITFADIVQAPSIAKAIEETPPLPAPEDEHEGHCHAIKELEHITGSVLCCLPALHTGQHDWPFVSQ